MKNNELLSRINNMRLFIYESSEFSYLKYQIELI